VAVGLTTLTGPGIALAAGAPPGLVPARAQTGFITGLSHRACVLWSRLSYRFPDTSSRYRARRPQPRLARRWARVAGLFAAVGAVSGTLLSVEMSLLWPGMMAARRRFQRETDWRHRLDRA
jgi:cytochrome bd ubiquinol oxidase subunit I